MATVLELAIREGSGIEILGEPQERLALMSGDLQTIPASKGFSLKHYRLSPVFRNNLGMLGYMSLGIMRYGLDAYLKKWGHDETYFDGVDVLKVLTENPDAFMEWSLLAGVIDIPETIIESLKCEKERAMGSRKRRVGTDRDFINAFGLSQFTDELNIPGFNSDEFGLNGVYRTAYHPDSHNPNLFDMDVLKGEIKHDTEVLVGYLAKMQDWVRYAQSEDWRKKPIQYSEVSLALGPRV